MKHVYILKSIKFPKQRYVGVTSNLSQRLAFHNTGRCQHTSKFMPWEIAYAERYKSGTEAFARERQIKGWTRAKKEALIDGNKMKLKNLAQRRVFKAYRK